MSWFPGMGCFLSLHLAAFWGFFGMEVGMLMPPAPLGPPPGWAGGERCFFLFSFVPPSPHPPILTSCPLWWTQGRMLGGWVRVCVLPGGGLELAGRGVPPSDHPPPEPWYPGEGAAQSRAWMAQDLGRRTSVRMEV